MRDKRLFSRSIPKDIDHRLAMYDGDIEQAYTEVILELEATNDKWKRKFLRREADELFKMYCDKEGENNVYTETDNA